MRHRPHPSGADAVQWVTASWPTRANGAGRMRTSKGIMSATSPSWRRKDGRSPPRGTDAWRLAAGHPWSCAAAATRASPMVAMRDPASDVLGTGEPRETATRTRGSERGRGNRTPQGTSLAAYSTARPVLTREWGNGPRKRYRALLQATEVRGQHGEDHRFGQRHKEVARHAAE